jgi:hypothetical protein
VCCTPRELRILTADKPSNDDAWQLHAHYRFCVSDPVRADQWLHYLAANGDEGAKAILQMMRDHPLPR